MPTPLAVTSRHKARTFVLYFIAALAHVAPGLAARLALRIFSTPHRTAQTSIFAGAEPWSIGYAGRRLSIWRWKPQAVNGLRVLLVHGWSGNAGQFAAWVPALLAKGYEVVAFDAPAHGVSGGKHTNLLDFAGAIRQVATVAGKVDAIVAHSMAGAATVIAMSEGLRVERAVLLAPPDNVEARLERFAGWLAFTQPVRAKMQRQLARRFGRPLSSVRLAALAPRIDVPVLVVHDADDREVPWLEGARTAAVLPQGRLHTVRGLSHTRILRDATVIEAAVGFLTEADETRLGLRDANLEAFIERFEAA